MQSLPFQGGEGRVHDHDGRGPCMVQLGECTTLKYVHYSHLVELLLTSSCTVHNGHPVPQEARHRYRIPTISRRTCWLPISCCIVVVVDLFRHRHNER